MGQNVAPHSSAASADDVITSLIDGAVHHHFVSKRFAHFQFGEGARKEHTPSKGRLEQDSMFGIPVAANCNQRVRPFSRLLPASRPWCRQQKGSASLFDAWSPPVSCPTRLPVSKTLMYPDRCVGVCRSTVVVPCQRNCWRPLKRPGQISMQQ